MRSRSEKLVRRLSGGCSSRGRREKGSTTQVLMRIMLGITKHFAGTTTHAKLFIQTLTIDQILTAFC